MYKNYNITEVTKENERKYLCQIANLEKAVLDNMEKNGKIGQLFITGKDDIRDYIRSKENTVMVSINNNDNVVAATYITMGQKPFTYNDITKYFKFGEENKEYTKAKHDNSYIYRNRRENYVDTIKRVYSKKLSAFIQAKEKILDKYGEKIDFNSLIEKEKIENEFHEKSDLREKINEYMSQYMIRNNCLEEYEKYYWLSIQDIAKEMHGKELNLKAFGEDVQQYEKIMQLQRPEIYEKTDFDAKKYYNANTRNTVELDTYITDPNNREIGLARILVFEGIKKYIKEYFENKENKEMFLCSTLHKDNLSSKYVSEFFGLKDSLYVKRRQGRNREVHICKITREEANQYLKNIEEKLSVLYGYNPNNIDIKANKRIEILKSQLKYEIEEKKRLSSIQKNTGKYTGYIKQKEGKIYKLVEKINEEKQRIYQEKRNDDEGR